MRYRIELLTSDHMTMGFDCGHGNSLGDWLINKAIMYQEENIGRVYVMLDTQKDDQVCGYFTLLSHQITTQSITKRDRRGKNEKATTVVGSHSTLPSQLLGKFALDSVYQGCDASIVLMYFVYKAFLDILQYTAARYLIVEVRENKIGEIYQKKFKFALSPQKPESNNLSIYYKKSSDIKQEFDLINSELNKKEIS